MIRSYRVKGGAPGENFWFFCDGCDMNHRFVLKLAEHKLAGGHRCHLFLKRGMVQYLGDCTHALAGQTVPMKATTLSD